MTYKVPYWDQRCPPAIKKDDIMTKIINLYYDVAKNSLRPDAAMVIPPWMIEVCRKTHRGSE